jgi:hypothetical protein
VVVGRKETEPGLVLYPLRSPNTPTPTPTNPDFVSLLETPHGTPNSLAIKSAERRSLSTAESAWMR